MWKGPFHLKNPDVSSLLDDLLIIENIITSEQCPTYSTAHFWMMFQL